MTKDEIINYVESTFPMFMYFDTMAGRSRGDAVHQFFFRDEPSKTSRTWAFEVNIWDKFVRLSKLEFDVYHEKVCTTWDIGDAYEVETYADVTEELLNKVATTLLRKKYELEKSFRTSLLENI